MPLQQDMTMSLHVDDKTSTNLRLTRKLKSIPSSCKRYEQSRKKELKLMENLETSVSSKSRSNSESYEIPLTLNESNTLTPVSKVEQGELIKSNIQQNPFSSLRIKHFIPTENNITFTLKIKPLLKQLSKMESTGEVFDGIHNDLKSYDTETTKIDFDEKINKLFKEDDFIEEEFIDFNDLDNSIWAIVNRILNNNSSDIVEIFNRIISHFEGSIDSFESKLKNDDITKKDAIKKIKKCIKYCKSRKENNPYEKLKNIVRILNQNEIAEKISAMFNKIIYKDILKSLTTFTADNYSNSLYIKIFTKIKQQMLIHQRINQHWAQHQQECWTTIIKQFPLLDPCISQLGEVFCDNNNSIFSFYNPTINGESIFNNKTTYSQIIKNDLTNLHKNLIFLCELFSKIYEHIGQKSLLSPEVIRQQAALLIVAGCHSLGEDNEINARYYALQENIDLNSFTRPDDRSWNDYIYKENLIPIAPLLCGWAPSAKKHALATLHNLYPEIYIHGHSDKKIGNLIKKKCQFAGTFDPLGTTYYDLAVEEKSIKVSQRFEWRIYTADDLQQKDEHQLIATIPIKFSCQFGRNENHEWDFRTCIPSLQMEKIRLVNSFEKTEKENQVLHHQLLLILSKQKS